MFGYSSITRQIRKWRVERDRIAIETMLSELPLELQKDIGWPTARTRQPRNGPLSAMQARATRM